MLRSFHLVVFFVIFSFCTSCQKDKPAEPEIKQSVPNDNTTGTQTYNYEGELSGDVGQLVVTPMQWPSEITDENQITDQVITDLAQQLAAGSSGAIQFPNDMPLSSTTWLKLVEATQTAIQNSEKDGVQPAIFMADIEQGARFIKGGALITGMTAQYAGFSSKSPGSYAEIAVKNIRSAGAQMAIVNAPGVVPYPYQKLKGKDFIPYALMRRQALDVLDKLQGVEISGFQQVATAWKLDVDLFTSMPTEIQEQLIRLWGDIMDVRPVHAIILIGANKSDAVEKVAEQLRNQLKYDGVVIANWLYISMSEQPHVHAANQIKSGVDQILAASEFNVGLGIQHALDQGMLTKSDIAVAAGRIAKLKELLKLETFPFYPANRYPEQDPRYELSSGVNAAQESMVVLKNANGTLPLPKEVRLTYFGEMAMTFKGWTSPSVMAVDSLYRTFADVQIETAVEHAQRRLEDATYGGGLSVFADLSSSNLKQLESDADAVIICMRAEEIAGLDRGFYKNMNTLDNRVVVCVVGDEPVDLDKIHEASDALVFGFSPGEWGGRALFNLVTGVISPRGKLPYPWPGESWKAGYGEVYIGYNIRAAEMANVKVSEEHPIRVAMEIQNAGNAVNYVTMPIEIAPVGKTLDYVPVKFEQFPLTPRGVSRMSIVVTAAEIKTLTGFDPEYTEPGMYKIRIGTFESEFQLLP